MRLRFKKNAAEEVERALWGKIFEILDIFENQETRQAEDRFAKTKLPEVVGKPL